jgi:amino acid transporter
VLTARRDRGQAAVFVLVMATTLFVVLAVALVDVGGRMIDRTRAQTAADAAALGSISGGRGTAAALAERHGATLIAFEREPGDRRVTVVVRLGTVTARAAASDLP